MGSLPLPFWINTMWLSISQPWRFLPSVPCFCGIRIRDSCLTSQLNSYNHLCDLQLVFYIQSAVHPVSFIFYRYFHPLFIQTACGKDLNCNFALSAMGGSLGWTTTLFSSSLLVKFLFPIMPNTDHWRSCQHHTIQEVMLGLALWKHKLCLTVVWWVDPKESEREGSMCVKRSKIMVVALLSKPSQFCPCKQNQHKCKRSGPSMAMPWPASLPHLTASPPCGWCWVDHPNTGKM